MAKNLNVTGIVTGLDKLLTAVREMAPVAEAIGGAAVANVATLVIAGAAIAQNVLERAEGMKEALSSQDEAKLRAMLAELQEANDKLAGTIAEG